MGVELLLPNFTKKRREKYEKNKIKNKINEELEIENESENELMTQSSNNELEAIETENATITTIAPPRVRRHHKVLFL